MNAQHGGPPAALMVGELERTGDGRPFARIAVHLLKPVPLAPLTLTTEIVRDGRRARRTRAELKVDGELVCFAHGLQIAPSDSPMPDLPIEAEPITAHPDTGTPPPNFTGYTMFPGHGIEVSFVRGHLTEPGPATAWFRLRGPVVDDEPVTALERTMAAADFGNGISSAVRWDDFTFVNPELTVFLLRDAEGEWIGNDAVTAIDPSGIGLASAVLHDERGPFGRALQSLYVAPRK